MAKSSLAFSLILFAVLACLLAWPLHIAAALGAKVAAEHIPLGPIAAAAITAAVLGRGEAKSWWRRLLSFRTSVAWYLLALAAPALLIGAAVLANHAFGAPLPGRAGLAGWTSLPGNFAFMLLLVGVGEEAGWTAFAAPLLLRGGSILVAWAILAPIRVLWHLPLMLNGQLPWVLGVGGNIAFQFLLLWLFVRSGEVWFLAAIWHAALNALGGSFFFQMVQGMDQARLGVLMTLAYALLAAVILLADFGTAARRPAFQSRPA